ncbi:MAG: MoaD/ThiS family protein [Deltaproteobacteria bacterium]|nr:MoaD/ThiS family protein [Deltaproteobacteria bacterium]MBW2724567.1 MoaD/ThiS family protein [Deltaproteobacteria bacterium]
MSIRVDLTYDMSKALGVRSLDLESAQTVKDVVEQTQARFADKGEQFAKLAHVTAIAVNGILTNYRKGMKTKLSDGDRVGFVKAASGG